MFRYLGNHQQMGGDGTKEEADGLRKSIWKKKRNFFGSPPPSFINSSAGGRSRLDGNVAKDDLFFGPHGCQQMPRSRSCQCTARIGNVPTKNEIGGGMAKQEEMMDHRKWWMEELSTMDIPTIDGQGKDGKKEKWRSRSKKEEIIIGNVGTKSSSNSMNHQPFLLPMLLNNSAATFDGGGCSPSINYCCSDSPCSSSSLTLDQIPILSQYQNGNQNGNIPPPQQKGQLSPEQWPSNDELANCLGQIFPSIDEWKANSKDVLASLLCLRPFISPPQILHKLLQHTIFVQHANAANFSKEGQRRLFDNVLAFCALWIRSIPYDFRGQPMRDRLLAVLSLSGTQKDTVAQRLCDDLLAELRMALGRLERYEGAIRSLEPQLERNWEKRWEGPGGLMATGRTPIQIAQQLAHIELERLSMVGLDELVQTIGQANSLDQLGQLSPPGCVGHYVQWFNQLSQLVASEVLRHQHKRHRAKCMDFLVKVASECLALGNFNSLAAIVAGLSAQPVARLKKSWAKADKNRLEVLQRQLDPSGNFAAYRATLKAAMIWAASAGSSERMPQTEAQTQCCSTLLVIPFFGLLLKDLFHLYCQCRLPGPGGHLNRIAFDEFGELMAQVEGWKRVECKFTRISPILQHLLLAPLLPERSMFLLSYGYEVPENNADREQFRQFNQTNLQEKMKRDMGHKDDKYNLPRKIRNN